MTVESIGRFDLQSLQIYFNGVPEIQEELIKAGFRVPRETPLPIVYGDYGGYEKRKAGKGTLRAALLDPPRYGETTEKMGWQPVDGDRYNLPQEKAQLDFSLEPCGSGHLLHLSPVFMEGQPGFHLEKASYRAGSPDTWPRWTMFYVGLQDSSDIVSKIAAKIGFPSEICDQPIYVKHENLPKGGGHEDTYYAGFAKGKGLGIDIHSYSLCLGCFEHVLPYLEKEADLHQSRGLSDAAVRNLRLRIQNSPDIPMTLQVGLAKVDDKAPQLMLKMATAPGVPVRKVMGVDKDGRPILIPNRKQRGVLVSCDHACKRNEIVLGASDFLRAACCARRFFYGDAVCLREEPGSQCHSNKLLRPTWSEIYQ